MHGGVRGGRILKDHPQTAADVLHNMQLSHYQVINLEYSFAADFRHGLICESLIFARFRPWESGSPLHGMAYTRVYTVT